MSLLDTALAASLTILLVATGLGSIYLTLRTERPDARKTPWLSVAAWWLGQLLGWAMILTLAGGLLGLAARAGWRILNG